MVTVDFYCLIINESLYWYVIPILLCFFINPQGPLKESYTWHKHKNFHHLKKYQKDFL